MEEDLVEGRDYIEKAYVVGAGFSKAFGFPLMSEILEEVESFCSGGCGVRYRKLPERLKEFQETFFPSFTGGTDIVTLFNLLQSAVDMEEAVPAAGELLPSRILADLRKTLCQVFHCQLFDIVQDSSPFEGRFFPNHGAAAFVSFNWDTLLERGLFQTGAKVRFFESSDSETDTTVFKLHGSSDWVYRQGNDKWPLDDYWPLSSPLWNGNKWDGDSIIRSMITESRLRSVEDPEAGWVSVRDDPPEPMMITMGHGKGKAIAAEPYRRIRNAWKQAAKFLARAQRLVIIGYSIPPDDIEARLLLRYAIWQRKEQFGGEPSVKVIDKRSDSIDRIQNALGIEVERVEAPFDPDDQNQWA